MKKEKGFAAMATVLFAGAIAFSVVFSALGSVSSVLKQNSLLYKSVRAQSLAHSCAEIALQQIRDATAFEGEGSRSVDEGNCEYFVMNDGEEKRTIQSESVVDDVFFRVIVKVDGINPKINIVFWDETNNF